MYYKILFTIFFSVILLTSAAIPGFLSNFAYAEKGKITICHVPPGNPSNSHTIYIPSQALDAHMNHGDYAGECKSSNQEQSKNQQSKDKSSSNNYAKPPSKNKITICHNPSGNPKNAHTMTIGSKELAAHLDHRDNIGACKTNIEQPKNKAKQYSDAATPALDHKVTICHTTIGNPENSHTIKISKLALDVHLSMGDTLGACKTNIEQPENKGNQYFEYALSTSDHKVIMCHIPPGSTSSSHTISISLSALTAHLSHGDYKGGCNYTTTDVLPRDSSSSDIVQKPIPKNIPNYSDNRVTICHTPIGNPENSHTIKISKFALDAHLSMGDTLGACPFDQTEKSKNPNSRVLTCHFIPGKDNKEGIPQNPETTFFITDRYQNKMVKYSKLEEHLENNPYDYAGRCSIEHEGSGWFYFKTFYDSYSPNKGENARVYSQHYGPQYYGPQYTPSLPDGSATSENNKKVTVTHIPPGNPDNAHEISVSANAVKGHEKHGDPSPTGSHNADTSNSNGKSDSSKSNSNGKSHSSKSKQR